jgi:ankyrin repeat protein
MDPSSLVSVAAYAGQVEMIEYLIARGLPVDCGQDAGCKSPLRWALQSNQGKNNRKAESLEVLLRAGANPNADNYGLLNVAVDFGDMEALKVLLRGGADANRTGRDPTPLALALRGEKEHAADILRAFGATR